MGVFRTPAADSVSLDLMHSLVMETEGDVVFVLSSNLGLPAPETNQVVAKATSVDSAFVCPVAVPVRTQLYVYDSMGEDKVLPYKGSAVLRPLVYNNGALTEDGLKSLALRSMSGGGSEQTLRELPKSLKRIRRKSCFEPGAVRGSYSAARMS